MESAQRLLLNLENNFISLFQLLLLKDACVWAVPAPQPHVMGIKLSPKMPRGGPSLGYGEKVPWVHNHNLCYRVQTLCFGRAFPLVFQDYIFFFLLWRAGCAVKRGVCAQVACGASTRCFVDRREIFRPRSLPAGHQPALNWKPSNDMVRARTTLEMRMLTSAAHFSVIQEWPNFFLPFFPLFFFFSFFFYPPLFFYFFLFFFPSGHKTILCSAFPLKPPKKQLKLSASSYDSYFPHSPTLFFQFLCALALWPPTIHKPQAA